MLDLKKYCQLEDAVTYTSDVIGVDFEERVSGDWVVASVLVLQSLVLSLCTHLFFRK